MALATVTGTRRAVIYCRISQDRAGAGLGVARQEEDGRRLCERLCWDVAAVYADNDLSAYRGKRRPGYEAMIEALASGAVDAVVAWHPDRLHRAPRELEDFIDAVERAGADVATVTAGEVDLATPAGRMTARIHGAVARHESEHKSERIRRKHLELAQAGKVPGGGRRPFGYESDRVTIREDEADLIRDAAARALAGESLRSVVADWNERGIPTVTGARWSPTTLKRLLMSGRISGRREHRGTIVADAEWPAIVTAEQSTRLRALLTDQRRNRAAGVAARSYLLTGVLYCGRWEKGELVDGCGARMTTRPSHSRGKKYLRYICAADRGGCGRCGINAPQTEELVRDAVLAVLESPKMAKAIAAKRARGAKPAPLDDLAAIDERRAELAEMYARREINAREWQTARSTLDEEERRLQAVTVERTHAAQAMPELENLRDRWGDLDLDRKRAVIVTVVDRVHIAPTPKGSNRFDPNRVDVEWKV